VNLRLVARVVALVTAFASGWYFVVYLTRWEWNRALVSGIVFLAVEIVFFATLLLDRLNTLRERIDEISGTRATEPSPRPDVLARVEESAPEPRDPFSWMRPDQTAVFVPVLLGAGVLVSAVAWLVERVALLTARPHLERALARRLEAIAPPRGGLLPDVVAVPVPPRADQR
jgi:hypothetical protein